MQTRVEQWIYSKRPTEAVGVDHYKLESATADSDLSRGEVWIEGRYWSVDPYMRIQQSSGETWEAPHPIGGVQGGGVVGQIARVGEGVDDVAPGDWVEAYLGWRTAGRIAVDACRRLDPNAAPTSTALHVLGMPGRIAYFGLLEAGRPQPGDTLLVSGAAGAVGSIVGQLGRLSGCRVMGVVGSKEKAAWITGELGFDGAIIYKGLDTLEAATDAIRTACPDGVDVYYDNTGGVISDAVFVTMNIRARIVVCGQISQYQTGLDEPILGPRLLHHMLYKRATMTGVLARDYTARMDEMLVKMTPWVASGEIKYRETISSGFHELPNALAGLFRGDNIGKSLVAL